ncbi:MAG TPA: flagellar hook-basal body complex protein FliE [Nautiliaceae bacterium]|nr:flagellar hook-basal body complex protein FliE [Nautiliaceae bacterium]
MAFINKVNNNLNAPLNHSQNKNSSVDFGELLKKELDSTNEIMHKAEEAQANIATGSVKDLAKASITIQKAEMQMKMVLEVRNKAINAYKELLKTQI